MTDKAMTDGAMTDGAMTNGAMTDNATHEQPLLTAQIGRVRRLTLHRPDKRNALNFALAQARLCPPAGLSANHA
jgi:hypothetical protein